VIVDQVRETELNIAPPEPTITTDDEPTGIDMIDTELPQDVQIA